ncbi:MAG: tetratricopeptide repeat protein [Candidatus Altiarchaeota archaeon]|nr:tetratricopeptide repeat protein [Candidatus Altiarchaeota archaeon]
MRKLMCILALITLIGFCTAREMPSEEECYGEIQAALGNIKQERENLAANDYVSAGSCYKNRKGYDKAAECFLKAVELDKEVGSYGGAGAAYSSAGDMYREMENEEKAREYYHLAIDTYMKAGFRDTSPARVYKKLGDYDNACKYCNMDDGFSHEECIKYGFCKEGSLSAASPGGVGLLIPLIVLGVILGGVIFFVIKRKK